MSKKVLIINGATREGGNTDTLLSKLSDGMESSGLQVIEVRLRDLNISDCIGCCQCLKEKSCHFEDDMTNLRKSLIATDVIVFASPIYWCEVTGLMKTFVDRLYFFHHQVNRDMISGKKALILTTLGEKEASYESEVLVEFYRRFLGSLGIEIIDMLFFADLMEKDAIKSRPGYLDRAYTAGKRLSTISD
ncbi:MAG: flavodoxin family protein [Candidatus Zixiibacteriota bacterium]|nr:MAG: flavodoxin family protein [candidate division Zixibacteria bacterium]